MEQNLTARLTLSEATLDDLYHAGQDFVTPTDHLLAPSIPFFWKVNTADEAGLRRRAAWCAQHNIDLYNLDPTAYFVKVTDNDTTHGPQLIGLARWHHYAAGYSTTGDIEFVGALDVDEPNTWPAGFNKDEYLGYWREAMAARREWQGTGRCWVLTTISTRESFRRRGAAGLMLQWGLTRARQDGVPAFLEAVPEAKRVYEKHGFREIGRQEVKATGEVIVISRMRADP